MSRLRIATFNVNGIRSRLPHLLQWLEREQPDIACLQELKAADEGFPRAQLEAAGYGARWQGQPSWNGVAILARGARPIESRRGLPGDPDDTHSRYLEAVAHGVVVGCLYLPNGNPQPGPKFDYKLRWFARLIAHAKSLHASGHPVVLAGDFNVVPTDELDIYNPRSWRRDALLQPASRAAWGRLLEQGWTDALRTLHPEEKIFTFWDYFREHWPRNAGLRIDHLLLSPALAPRLRTAGVDRWVRALPGASDHAPTWIELDMAGKLARHAKGASQDSAAEAPVVAQATTDEPIARRTRGHAGKTAKKVQKKASKPSAKRVAKQAMDKTAQDAPEKRPRTAPSARRAAKNPPSAPPSKKPATKPTASARSKTAAKSDARDGSRPTKSGRDKPAAKKTASARTPPRRTPAR